MFLAFIMVDISPLSIAIRALFLITSFSAMRFCSRTIAQRLIIIYIIYNIFSIIPFLFSGIDISAYTYDVLNFLLPMFAYFWGSNKKRVDYDFYKGLTISIIVCIIIGLYWYLFSTEWYSLRLVQINNANGYYNQIDESGDTTGFLQYARFSSFMMTPYAIQYLGIVSLIFYMFHISYKPYYNNRMISISIFIILLIGLILCMQRTAWGYMAILFVFHLFYNVRYQHQSHFFRYFIIIGVLVLVAGVFLSSSIDRVDIIIGQLLDRGDHLSASDALGGRKGQYMALLNNWNNYLFGHGMGSGGAAARISGHPGASDANYMKILYENGIVGSLLFLSIIGCTLTRCLKYLKYYYVEFNICSFYLLAMIGSNSLCISFYYSIPFWYAIGRIWNVNYLKTKKNNLWQDL